MMSSLTEAQRLRIENNKKLALEKRAAAQQVRGYPPAAFANQTPGVLSIDATQPGLNVNATAFIPSAAYSIPRSPHFHSSSLNSAAETSSNWRDKHPLTTSWQNYQKNLNSSQKKTFGSFQNSTQNVSKGVSKEQFFGKKVNGPFTLISSERFFVDISYHAEAIDIFKTIKSKNYDAQARRWDFHVSDHDALIKALAPLKPGLCVSPLPKFIHKTLKKSKAYGDPSKLDLSSIDDSLLEAFMPFQREGVCFGVSRNGRVMIADDMGLGKTIQALGVASYYRSDWPLLIVAPSSVKYSWASAIERWMGSVDSDNVIVANTGKDELEGEVLIISYDLMARKHKEIKALGYKTIILDESHMLKNSKSIRCKAATQLMKSGKRIIMLSGTPALSRPIELFSQISGLDGLLIPPYQEFGIRYCAGKQMPWGWNFTGSSNTSELQILLESTVMIRRLKRDVLKQLPDKTRMTVMLDPNAILKQKALRDAEKVFNKSSEKDKTGAMLLFFRESAVAKHKAVCEYVKDMIENGKKFLVFAHHQYMMDKLSETCDEMKTAYIRIDGKVSGQERDSLVEHFQQTEETKVAILSITAANTGITLTAAQLVVFAELFWNPGALLQAEDRTHRIGQQSAVLVQYLVAKGTVDDFIWPLIQRKLNILQKVGLSKESFDEVSSSNQISKANGIERYLVPTEGVVDDLSDSDLLAALMDEEAEVTSLKRNLSNTEISVKRRKVAGDC